VRRQLELLVVAAVAAVDQATKLLVVTELGLHETVEVIPGLLNLTHVRNSGVAFGFLNAASFAFKPALMAALAFAALIGVALYATQLSPHQKWARTGLALILGGAAGNLVDRARQGYVVDFVDVYWGTWHFWAFNVADAAISVGVSMLILDLLRPAPRVSVG
jgi:signal peptidase II